MRLIYGAPGGGKTAAVFREFTEAHKQGKSPLRIVVPTATLVRHYRHELARAGLVIDPKCVVSLAGFAGELVPAVNPAPEGLIRALIRAELAAHPPAAFGEAAGSAGMVEAFAETIGLFENADASPGKLPKLSTRTQAFARAWKRVDDEIRARGFATRGRLFRTATEKARSGEARLPVSVWMDGFLKLSPLEQGLVDAVARATDLAITRQVETASEGQLSLFDSPRKVDALVVRSPAPPVEAEEIARRIVEMAGQGFDFSDMAVAVRDIDSWLPLLRATFDRFGIPARFYFSEPARNHPAIRFLGGLMSCALGGWDFATTVAALRANPAWGSSADFDRFDFKIRAVAPGRGAGHFLQECESEWLRKRIARCLAIEAWRGRSATASVWRSRLESWAAEIYRPGTVPEPAAFSDTHRERILATGIGVWNRSLAVAEAVWMPGVDVSFEAFCETLRGELDSARFSLPDDRRNVVHVMSAFEARQWSIRALFVCDVTARNYPRRNPPNLFLTDGDVMALHRSGVMIRTSAEAERDEAELFDVLKTRGRDQLILSLSATDFGGRAVEPSARLVEFAESANAVPCRCVPIAAPPATGEQESIGADAGPMLAERHKTVSVSALQDLMKCRFQFFARQTLRLPELPIGPPQRLDARMMGIIFHVAVEEWLGNREQDFGAMFEECFERESRKRNLPPGYRMEVRRVEFRRIAAGVAEQMNWRFDSTEAEVPCTIEFPGGITVKCRPDRIDRLPDGRCVIVDYKSSKEETVEKIVRDEAALQGPLYCLSVRETKGMEPAAMMFFAVRTGEAFGWGSIPGWPGENLRPFPENWMEDARMRSAERLGDYLTGNIRPEPHDPEDCRYCDARNACRYELRPVTVTEPATGAAGA